MIKFPSVFLYYTGEKEMEKGKIVNEGKNKSQDLGFLSHNIHLATLKVNTKFEDSGCHRRREICDRKFDLRERKMDNERER